MSGKKYVEVGAVLEFADVFFADPILRIATRSLLAAAPAAKVEEPIFGYWSKIGSKWVCSHCRARLDVDGTPEENNIYRCPNCGMRQKGGTE